MLAQAASVASRYAFGADGVGAARPGACGEADRRLALRARRSALRAQRRSPICVLHTRAPSASSACKGCSWCSARGAQLRRSAGRSARTQEQVLSYACLRIRWHGSPCGPAVREVVHQFSVEGLRVRGPIALASAREQHQRLAQPRCLPLTPGVKSRWRLRSGAESSQEVCRIPHLLLPLRRFERIVFAPVPHSP